MTDIRLGPYQLVAELGSGGMGTVYRTDIVEPVDGIPVGAAVAVKVLHPHLFSTEGFYERFLREARLGRSVHHPNVVGTLDGGVVHDGGKARHYLAMELVEGYTLRELIRRLGRVPEKKCRYIGFEIAKGLAAIHAAGIVHRDIKPENVLITPEDTVKIMDLGVARLREESIRLSQSGDLIGSVHYAAPECLTGLDADERADLHALGLVLYELVTGKHPFEAPTFCSVLERVLHEKPRSLREIDPLISPCFAALVEELLYKDREKRLTEAARIATILQNAECSHWWGRHCPGQLVPRAPPLTTLASRSSARM